MNIIIKNTYGVLKKVVFPTNYKEEIKKAVFPTNYKEEIKKAVFPTNYKEEVKKELRGFPIWDALFCIK